MNVLREHCKWVLHKHEAVLRAALRDAPLATEKGQKGSEHVVFPPTAAEAEARRALVPKVPERKAFTFSMDALLDKAAGAKEKLREVMDGGSMTTLWLQARAARGGDEACPRLSVVRRILLWRLSQLMTGLLSFFRLPFRRWAPSHWTRRRGSQPQLLQP